MRLILASGSAIRRKILDDAGIPFEVLKGNGEEVAPAPGEDAVSYVTRCAAEKALDCWRAHGEALAGARIIGCDQVVRFEGEILRKVRSDEEAIARLASFRGKTHELVNGFAIVEGGELRVERHRIVTLTMRELPLAEIEAYIALERPLSSVACYFLEGQGMKLVAELDGDYFSALGLPLSFVVDELLERGERLF